MDVNTEKYPQLAPSHNSLPARNVEILYDDIGAQLFQEVQQYSPEELAAERKKVLRKIDFYMLPVVCSKSHLSVFGIPAELICGRYRYALPTWSNFSTDYR